MLTEEELRKFDFAIDHNVGTTLHGVSRKLLDGYRTLQQQNKQLVEALNKGVLTLKRLREEMG